MKSPPDKPKRRPLKMLKPRLKEIDTRSVKTVIGQKPKPKEFK
jgi:hypothetical protein